MANWRLAESLKVLRQQLNAMYPNRSKVSDGSVGDLSHSARTSDHNPNAAGVVCAIDVTNDPKTLKGQWLADALIASRDPRIKYVIFNHQMCRSYPAHGKPAWTWQPYNGANAHEHHVHLSVSADKALYDSTKDWALPVHRAASDDIQPGESSAIASPVVPPGEEVAASVEIVDGNVKVETSGPAVTPEHVVIEKPEPVGFIKSIKKKLGIAGGTNLGIQALRDQFDTARGFGFSPRFWMWVSIIGVVGASIWIAIEWVHHWQAHKRELAITDALIKANTTATNRIELLSKEEIARLDEKKGIKIVRR